MLLLSILACLTTFTNAIWIPRIYGTLSDLLQRSANTPELDSFHKRATDPCAMISSDPDGIPRYDCSHVTSLNGTGQCTVLTTDGRLGCTHYCEIRRRAFLGTEFSLPVFNGVVNFFPPGQQTTYEKGVETSVEFGVSLGVGGELEEVFEAGIDFSYTVSELSSTSIQLNGNASVTEWSTWIAFPILIETCGTIGTETSDEETGGRGPSIPICGGDYKETVNACSTVAASSSSNGAPLLMYTQSKSLSLREKHR
jgi:hypothetical protein